ncbi:MAG: hypothetical protein IPN53_22970 [Comamonadaceae bacterium]|nr:hypothetical protein [Comamonadaceae bacterium]
MSAAETPQERAGRDVTPQMRPLGFGTAKLLHGGVGTLGLPMRTLLLPSSW